MLMIFNYLLSMVMELNVCSVAHLDKNHKTKDLLLLLTLEIVLQQKKS